MTTVTATVLLTAQNWETTYRLYEVMQCTL
jgi:hypothetical protein